MSFRTVMIYLALVMGAISSSAPAKAHEMPWAECLNAAVTNEEYAACTGAIVDAADVRLNAAWRLIFAKEGGTQTVRGQALIAEQRAWIEFRELACAEYMGPHSGREEEVIHGPLCVAAIIEARTDDLHTRAAFGESIDYARCLQVARPAAVDAQTGECARGEIARVDARLNSLWPRVLEAAGGRNSEIGTALVEEQRAWIAFKSVNCRHYNAQPTGTMEMHLFGPWCELQTLRDRVAYLESVLVELSS